MFEQAQASETSFYIVKGEVELLEAPNVPNRGAKLSTKTQARIAGKAMTRAGFVAPFIRDVVIEASCIGPWCGNLNGLDGKWIMAVEIAERDQLILNVDPCGGDVVPWDTLGEERLMNCFLEGNCSAVDF